VSARRTRLDRLLVERGLCDTRSKAQALIVSGEVIVDEHRVDKPGTQVSMNADVRVRRDAAPFVSRGGVKLRGALDHFRALDVRDRVAMDIGASTGGFTDCLLQSGVRRVYAVDVGYGQLAWQLATDPRVVSLERTNIRELARERIPEPIDLVVADCSFISLTLVLPCVVPFLADRADLVVLVKPQFELGRERVGKGGIVRNAADRNDAIERVCQAATALGMDPREAIDSTLPGRDGNVETLLWLAWSIRVQQTPERGAF